MTLVRTRASLPADPRRRRLHWEAPLCKDARVRARRAVVAKRVEKAATPAAQGGRGQSKAEAAEQEDAENVRLDLQQRRGRYSHEGGPRARAALRPQVCPVRPIQAGYQLFAEGIVERPRSVELPAVCEARLRLVTLWWHRACSRDEGAPRGQSHA